MVVSLVVRDRGCGMCRWRCCLKGVAKGVGVVSLDVSIVDVAGWCRLLCR